MGEREGRVSIRQVLNTSSISPGIYQFKQVQTMHFKNNVKNKKKYFSTLHGLVKTT